MSQQANKSNEELQGLVKELQAKLDESQAKVRTLVWNDAFGCYTRVGFEKEIWPEIAERARYIIYFDIDGLHAINAAHGSYDPADAMIKLGFSVLRWTDYVASQLKSGDEFFVCMVEGDQQAEIGGQREKLDPQALVTRLRNSLKLAGLMSATFAIAVISADLMTNLKPAIDQVYAAKNSRPGGAGRRSST